MFIITCWVRALSSSKVPQPIIFSHKKHVDNHVSCEVCHPLYKDHASAGIPGIKTCKRCHEDVIYITPEKAKIRRYLESGDEITWQRVYFVAPHTYFSHRRHVTLGKISCEYCHGNVSEMTKPVTYQQVEIRMAFCISCHKKENVSEDCVDCHR